MANHLDDFLRRLARENGGNAARTFRPAPGMDFDAFEALVDRLEGYASQGLLAMGQKHRESQSGQRRIDGVRNVRLTEAGIERWG